MKIQGVFEAALLRYIQKNVDQRAEAILDWETEHQCCWGHTDDDSCCCDTSTRVSVAFRVPREVQRHGRMTWEYGGNFYDIIRMLDATEEEQ